MKGAERSKLHHNCWWSVLDNVAHHCDDMWVASPGYLLQYGNLIVEGLHLLHCWCYWEGGMTVQGKEDSDGGMTLEVVTLQW